MILSCLFILVSVALLFCSLLLWESQKIIDELMDELDELRYQLSERDLL